jgi:hypothetical protein
MSVCKRFWKYLEVTSYHPRNLPQLMTSKSPHIAQNRVDQFEGLMFRIARRRAINYWENYQFGKEYLLVSYLVTASVIRR